MKRKYLLNLFLLFSLFFITFSFVSCDFLFFVYDSVETVKQEPDNITVFTSYEKQSCDWLIIMYVDGDNDLHDALYLDLNEIENALYNYQLKQGTKPSVKIVALWDGYNIFESNYGRTTTHILELGADYTQNLLKLENQTKDLTATAYSSLNNWIGYNPVTKTAEANMGNVQTLENFLKWVDQYYESEHKILQFSNHGGGPRSAIEVSRKRGLCWDFTSDPGQDVFLKTQDVSSALSQAGYGTQPDGSKNQLDMFIFDICLGASIEDSYQFRDYAQYLVGSANAIPEYGMDYAKILDIFSTSATTKDIAMGIVDDFKDFYTTTPSVDWASEIKKYGSAENAKYLSLNANTLSVIDLSKVENVAKAVDNLAKTILTTGEDSLEKIIIKYGTPEKTISIKDYLKNNLSNPRSLGLPEEHNLVYQGTFTWLYDIGFMAQNIQALCDDILEKNTNSSDETLINTINNLKSKATLLTTALENAIVYTWREAPSIAQNNGVNPSIDKTTANNSLYYGKNRPYGITISGAEILVTGSAQFPVYNEGKAPDFYKTDLQFGKETSWGDLLNFYFSN